MLNEDNNKILQIYGTNEELKNKADSFNEFFAEVGKKTYEKTQEELIANHNVQALITNDATCKVKYLSFKLIRLIVIQ